MRPEQYLKIYKDIDWSSYISIAETLMSIDKDNLEHELLIQARLYAYWTGLLSLAKKDYDKLKRRLETTEAVLRNEILEEKEFDINTINNLNFIGTNLEDIKTINKFTIDKLNEIKLAKKMLFNREIDLIRFCMDF